MRRKVTVSALSTRCTDQDGSVQAVLMRAGPEAAEGGQPAQQLHADQAHVRGPGGRPALPRVPRRHPAAVHHRRNRARPRSRLLWQRRWPHLRHPRLRHWCALSSIFNPCATPQTSSPCLTFGLCILRPEGCFHSCRTGNHLPFDSSMQWHMTAFATNAQDWTFLVVVFDVSTTQA